MRILIAFLVSMCCGVAAAQGVPDIDIGPSCRASAAGHAGLIQNEDLCRKSEEVARDLLLKEWSSFPEADRNSCYGLTTTGTPGTYTELLTCLEMRRDTRKIFNSGGLEK